MELALREETKPTLPLASWLAGQLSAQTARAYRADVRQFLAFVGTELEAVCRADVQEYRHWLVGQYKPSTVNRKLSCIRQLFAEAVRHGIMPVSPADGIRGCRTEKGYSVARTPSLVQVIAVLDSLTGSSLPECRDRAMLYVMATLGLRRQEVADLCVDSIMEDEGQTCLEIHGKGNKRRREVLPVNALTAVRTWISAGELSSSAPLFPQLTRNGDWQIGSTLTGNGVWHIIRKRFATVGVRDLSPHSLRRFAITYLLQRGMPLWRVQRLAGHADPVTTQRYNQAADDLANSAAKYIDF